MIDKIICLLLGHKWHTYPEKGFPDYKVCDRCSKSIALSPYLTAGEVEYIEKTLINAVGEHLITRQSWFMKKGETNDNA